MFLGRVMVLCFPFVNLDDVHTHASPCAQIDLPDQEGRESILRVLLASENTDPAFDYAAIAAATNSYSGSDLKVCVCVCAAAVNVCVCVCEKECCGWVCVCVRVLRLGVYDKRRVW